MHLVNLKHADETVNFATAVTRGQGRDRGLFFPPQLPRLDPVDALLEQPFNQIATELLHTLIGAEIARDQLSDMVDRAFTFEPKLVPIPDGTLALELFHGPSLAFKDFGARFMAQCLHQFNPGQRCTILTATSGDTGAAVAHAFHQVDGIDVVILYPKNGVTPLQEKLFCTLGDNIRTFAVEDNFDACQALVKQSFEDDDIRNGLQLNSANSINIARLLAQVCYYAEAAARAPQRDQLVFSIPSGNFGNITAGAIAKAIGIPIKRLLAATNINDTVPRFFQTGQWSPNPTVATLSNAMDISAPNNYVRLGQIIDRHGWQVGREVDSISVDDDTTTAAMRKLHEQGYLAEPHTALAHYALSQQLTDGETGVFLGTAHPAKFLERVEQACGVTPTLPPILAAAETQPLLSTTIGSSFDDFRRVMLA